MSNTLKHVEAHKLNRFYNLKNSNQTNRSSTQSVKFEKRESDRYELANLGQRFKLISNKARNLLVAGTPYVNCVTSKKMTTPLALSLISPFLVGRRCRVRINAVSKALDFLRKTSIPSSSAKLVASYVVKLINHPSPLIRRKAMGTFTWLAADNKPRLSPTQANSGAKAIRARFKDPDASVRAQAIGNYGAGLLSEANLSDAEVKMAGPALRDRIDNEVMLKPLLQAFFSYEVLFGKRWVKKMNPQEAAAGARSMRAALVKRRLTGNYTNRYLLVSDPKADVYAKVAVRLDRKAVNYEVKELYKLTKSRDSNVRYLSFMLFEPIAKYHADKIKMNALRKWEKLLWSIVELPSSSKWPIGSVVETYIRLISRYRAARLDRAALKLVTLFEYYEYDIKNIVIDTLGDLYTKLGSNAKQRVAKAIRSRIFDSDDTVKESSVSLYGKVIYKYVKRSELLAAKADLKKLKVNDDEMRKLKRKALAAVNRQLLALSHK